MMELGIHGQSYGLPGLVRATARVPLAGRDGPVMTKKSNWDTARPCRRLTAFAILIIFLSPFPVEERAHEASSVRGKVRRLLFRFASGAPGRPRDPASGHYEPARGARWRRGFGLTKSAARAEKSPCWSAAKRASREREATNGRPVRQAVLRPPRINALGVYAIREKIRGLWGKNARTREQRGRGDNGARLDGPGCGALQRAASQKI